MTPIVQHRGPYCKADKNGNIRLWVHLKDGRQMHYARLVMMNFLHTNHIPHSIHVHHKDNNSLNDNVDNLELKTASDHIKIHHQRDYKYGVSKSENRNQYEKLWRNDPIRKEKLLAKRRERYQKYKQIPGWIERTREIKRLSELKIKERKKNEDRTI